MSNNPFAREDNGPWYQQFWAWFVLAPVITVVFLCSVMLYLAITTADGPILDNLYRDGRSYAERKDEDQWAAAHNLAAQFQIDGDRIQLRLNGEFEQVPNQLSLLFAFRTHATRDVTVTLTRAPNGRYVGRFPGVDAGERQLLLEPLDENQHWRLHGSITLPSSAITELAPSE
ncbi:MAG: FixH family protein [Saccharospirillum sp.]